MTKGRKVADVYQVRFCAVSNAAAIQRSRSRSRLRSRPGTSAWALSGGAAQDENRDRGQRARKSEAQLQLGLDLGQHRRQREDERAVHEADQPEQREPEQGASHRHQILASGYPRKRMASSRERVEAALALDVADRAPVSAWGHNYDLEWDAEMLAAETVERTRRLGFDLVKLQIRATTFAEGLGLETRCLGVPAHEKVLVRVAVPVC